MKFFHILLGLTILTVAACGSDATPDPNVRGVPTLPPPDWVESSAAISLDNIAQVSYLGRLDAPGTPSTIFAHALSPDSTRLAGLDNEFVLAWDLISGDLLFSAARGDANRIFFAPDKTEIYTLTTTGTVTIHQAETGVIQNTFEGSEDFTGAVAFDPESGWMAFGSLNGQIKIWDPIERQALSVIDAHRLRVISLSFSVDGERLVSASEDGTVQVWDWRSKQSIVSFEVEDVPYALRFSPDGTQVAASGAEKIALLSIDEGQITRTIDLGSGGTDLLVYSPDSSYILSGGAVQELALWNTQTGALVARLPETNGDRVAAVFSPDSTILLTSEMGGSAILWNLTTITGSTLNRASIDNPAPIFSVDWTNDSRLLTLFGATSAVYLWGVGGQ